MGLITIGVDIGQRVDPTALAVTEFINNTFETRLLERLAIGTPYPDVAKRISEVCKSLLKRKSEELLKVRLLPSYESELVKSDAAAEIWLVIDATGVGLPVVEIVREEIKDTGIKLTAAFFTHGDRTTIHRGRPEATVGKAYLVSRLQALSQTNRILLPRTPEALAMKEELRVYEIHVDANANDTYGAFKVGLHDDLVTALGLSVIIDPVIRKGTSHQG